MDRLYRLRTEKSSPDRHGPSAGFESRLLEQPKDELKQWSNPILVAVATE